MNIREALLEEHSRSQSDLISAYIGNHRHRFAELISLVYTNEDPLARRAAWTMGHCCREHPELIVPHLDRLIEFLAEPGIHPAIVRNAFLVLQTVDIPAALQGRIFNLCYECIDACEQTIATRVYAMTILAGICRSEPELAGEVELLITQHFRDGSPGFKSRARHIRRELKKLRV
ncbi:MAG: hypothetical protein P1U86_09815 [Verrucomicrobiales bacterium]|nr:hypothetical protein [Verrucomicrobiales bacterium]